MPVKEDVLAPALPRQRVRAGLVLLAVGPQGLLREDLQGAEHLADSVAAPELAVREVDGLA